MFYICVLKIFQTIAAQTIDRQLAAMHLVAVAVGDVFGQGRREVDLVQVGDRVAGLADEVDVGCGIGVEPFHSVDGADAHDLALLLEQGQVPVNSRQGDVRVLGLKHFVDHVRRRVGCGRAKTFQYGISFAELFRGRCHGHLPFFVFWGSLVYTHILSHDFNFVNKNYSHLHIFFKTRPRRFLYIPPHLFHPFLDEYGYLW